MSPLPRTFDNTLTAGDLPQQTPPSSSSLVSIGMADASHEERKRMASANDHSVQSHSAPLTSGDEEEMEDDGSYVSHEISLDDDFRADGDLQSLVDSVLDPHAVDFQPLLTSLNGAAMTPSHSMHSMMSEYEEFGPHAHEMGGSDGGYASSLDLGQQLAFAAGNLRIMLSRGLGAMQRHGKYNGNRLLASMLEAISAVGSNGGGGRGSNGYHGNDLRGRILSLGRDAKIALIVLCAVFAIGVIGKFNSTSSSVGDVTLSIHSDADKFLNNLDLSVPNKSKIRLPRPYDVMANVADHPLAITETPVYWEIPRSGSTTMMNIAATCFAKVVASEVGELDGHATDAVSLLFLYFYRHKHMKHMHCVIEHLLTHFFQIPMHVHTDIANHRKGVRELRERGHNQAKWDSTCAETGIDPISNRRGYILSILLRDIVAIRS